MKKIKLLIILILFLILILGIRTYLSSKYSLDEIADAINKSENIPNNIHITVKTNYINGKANNYEIYVKDDIIYTYQEEIENEETFNKTEELWNFKDKNIITIEHSDKIIYNKKIDGNGKYNPLTEILIGISKDIKATPTRLYKYYGIKKKDSKEYIKFSLETEENFYKMYYYIDSENWNVSEIECYKDYELEYKTIFTYAYDTVTEEDIPEFDINNYLDYQLIKRNNNVQVIEK